MNSPTRYPLLESIENPQDLRQYSKPELAALADELRAFLIESVAKTGGHLAANLGTVELTIALHYVLNTPHDRLVWDVGHQSYAHKVLTGRRSDMPTLRQYGGMGGFPRRGESPYDTFGVGHSSTSISAALGMALAARSRGEERKVAAIIGDGALSAGMAFEALNHAGDLDANLLVILNDNEMSISRNVGGMSRYLGKILSGKLYSSVRESGKMVLSGMPGVMELARRAEEHMKGMVVPGTLFEELGFNYIGPIDGHDLPTLVRTLRNVCTMDGPQILHVVTQKGKGYAPAENNPCAFHGVSKFDPATGPTPVTSDRPSYTEVFSDWICERGARDDQLVAITPAMREGSGLVEFAEQFPERFYDVGIAEQHAVTLAAGMACDGLRPVVAIYSTFLQRAYDQLIHDVALQNLPVTFAIDRGGLVGPDGPTHAGSFDLSYLRCIPNMVVMAPANGEECRQMLETAQQLDSPAAVRYPRGKTPDRPGVSAPDPLPVGQAQIVRHGHRAAILAFGSMVEPALKAGEALEATVVNMRFVKPLDETTIMELAARHALLVTVEENAVAGGAGEGVSHCLNNRNVHIPVLNLGLPDRFLEHGSREQLLSECGLDADGIRNSIAEFGNDVCNGQPGRVISQ